MQTTCCLSTLGATVGAITHYSLGVFLALAFDLLYFLTLPGDWLSTLLCIFVFTFVLVYLKLPPLFMKVPIQLFLLPPAGLGIRPHPAAAVGRWRWR